MSLTTCPTCGNQLSWSWEEAFDKFGFGDGDGLVMTEHVADALRNHGYTVWVEPWGIHNTVIRSIKFGTPRREQIPSSATLGYDDPRDYLPAKVITILDNAFPDGGVVQP